MRYVVYGPGAVGGTIAGLLHEAGRDVVLIARGRHLGVLSAGGLTLRDPDRTRTMRIPVVARPADIDWRRDGDVVVLAMKTQDTAGALAALSASARPDTPIVCAQNGVENERLALRIFPRVYAMCVMLPATHLEPGIVDAHSAPTAGVLDLGRYPAGVDEISGSIAADLAASRFSSNPTPDIMRWKYAKLLMNLGNSLEAACGSAARWTDLYVRARAEATACLAAAGITVATDEEDAARRGDLLKIRRVDGTRRGGGSSWQSLARGSGSIEADYLNGEIVLLGRLHGIPTPVNALLQRVANEMASRGESPGSRSAEDLEHALGGA